MMIGVMQRYDPRLKIALLLMLIVTIFAAPGFSSLLVVGILVVGLFVWQRPIFTQFIQRLRYLRWLLLFTLLMHLFFTPGRVLLGLRLLSYDGLLRGMMVDLQLALALFFTLFFSVVTTPSAVAWGAARILSPLKRLGFHVDEASGLVGLVLHFLPQVFELGAPLAMQVKQAEQRSLMERFQILAKSLGDAILGLIGEADQLAQALARGDKTLLAEEEACYLWKRRDSIGLASGLIFILLCWSL